MSILTDYAKILSPFTGFGDDPNWSVKFGIRRNGDNLPDWTSKPRLAQHALATGNGTITQRRGRDPWEITFRLWLPSADDLDRLDAMVGRRATLRYLGTLTKTAGGLRETIEDRTYLVYPQTLLLGLADVDIRPGGLCEVTATFQRAYVDPPPFTPPVWPAPPSPVPGYHDMVLATPGLVTYHRMSGGSTEASIGPDPALMTHTGSPASAASLVTGGDGAKQYTGTTMESSFTTTALSGATAGSLECWFREDALVDWAHILEQDSYPASRFQIVRQASSSTITVGFHDPVAGTDFNATGAYTPLGLTHVVATFDDANLRLYVNGAQIASVAMTGSYPVGSHTFRANKAGAEQLVGVIDEVAVYNVALDAATVLDHYLRGTAI
jgi:surface antigen